MEIIISSINSFQDLLFVFGAAVGSLATVDVSGIIGIPEAERSGVAASTTGTLDCSTGLRVLVSILVLRSSSLRITFPESNFNFPPYNRSLSFVWELADIDANSTA